MYLFLFIYFICPIPTHRNATIPFYLWIDCRYYWNLYCRYHLKYWILINQTSLLSNREKKHKKSLNFQFILGYALFHLRLSKYSVPCDQGKINRSIMLLWQQYSVYCLYNEHVLSVYHLWHKMAIIDNDQQLGRSEQKFRWKVQFIFEKNHVPTPSISQTTRINRSESEIRDFDWIL